MAAYRCTVGNNPYSYLIKSPDVEIDRNCRPWKCPTCGFDAAEQRYRDELLAKNGLTKLSNGLEGLVIKREEAEDGNQ